MRERASTYQADVIVQQRQREEIFQSQLIQTGIRQTCQEHKVGTVNPQTAAVKRALRQAPQWLKVTLPGQKLDSRSVPPHLAPAGGIFGKNQKRGGGSTWVLNAISGYGWFGREK